MIRLFEMFAGVGGACWALKKAKIKFKCVGFSEIYRPAIICFNNNFPGIRNFGDCRNINPEELPDFDLLTGGFPCQPFSEAGKHKGELDARGTLFYDIIRIAEVKEPKYIFLENVKGLTFKNHEGTFKKILSELDRIGYNVYWRVLNSKDYGIPQNRERVFFVCFRKDIDKGTFEFPKREKLKLYLKDIIDPPSKDTIVSVAIRNINRSKHQALGLPYGTFPKKYRLVYNRDIGVSYAVKSATHEFMIGRVEDVRRINSKLEKFEEERKIISPKDCFRFLNSSGIRKLTPKECFRLMGYLNDEIDLSGLTDSQKYKLAGEAWDINLVSKIFLQMLKPKEYQKVLIEF